MSPRIRGMSYAISVANDVPEKQYVRIDVRKCEQISTLDLRLSKLGDRSQLERTFHRRS
jgi:hypothetical protein